MRNVSTQSFGTDGNGKTFMSESLTIKSTDSQKVNGQLRLSPQGYTLDHRVVVGFDCPKGSPPISNYGDANQDSVSLYSDALTNAAVAKFYQQLNRGRASLGVTIASWKESNKMIQDRLSKTASFFEGRLARSQRMRRRYSSKDLANLILEGEFGWIPLVQDIHTATTSMFGDAIPPVKVTGRARETIALSRSLRGDPTYHFTYSGTRSACLDAFVYVENPNLWALNRMGLINPAIVAWDLVPWSFLVNFFVNIPAVLGQFTDLIGLNVSKISMTRKVRYLSEASAVYLSDAGHGSQVKGSSSWCNTNHVHKERVLGSIPTTTLQVRMPSLDWERTMILSALLVQRVRAFHTLFH